MRSLKYLLFAAPALAPALADAYTWAALGRSTVDHRALSHVSVIGYSGGLGSQFLKTAASRMRRLRETFPQRQYVAVYVDLERGTYSASKVGLTVMPALSRPGKALSATELVKQLGKFERLASLEFFSHSSIQMGVSLEKSDATAEYRFFLPTPPLKRGTPGIEGLRKNFVRGGYVTFNGCNMGWFLAAEFSKAWGVPVTGALTGSNFQELHEDGSWYYNDSGRYPSKGDWKSVNDLSFEEPQACRKGNCHRMVSEYSPYRGYWGNLGGTDGARRGLGFYKWFCDPKQISHPWS